MTDEREVGGVRLNRNSELKIEFLDSNIINSFRDVIRSSPIFDEHDSYKHQYNLICTFMDRVDSSIHYLNTHSDVPKSENDFVFFLVFAAILKDGVMKLYENIFHKKPLYINEKKYFCDVKISFTTPLFSPNTCPTDDDFFEYVRALAFAHPYDVSGREKIRPFMKNGEKHYCPWVIVNDSLSRIFGYDDAVGLMVYSSVNEEESLNVVFSFEKLKEYLRVRYESISELKTWAIYGIEEQTKMWKQVKVNRNQDEISILKEIREILKDRFESIYTLEMAINYLECPVTDISNSESVSLFRKAILQKVPVVCDLVDQLDHAAIEGELSFIYDRPNNLHDMAHYQLDKIYTYLDIRNTPLDPNSNECWGLIQAEEFYKQFAHKWVTIDVSRMSYDEIKLLVSVACFMEIQAQKERK